MSDDPRWAFRAMFEEVRAYLLGEGRAERSQGRVATNPKGEATRAFDAEAERIALAVARRELGSFRVFSEEAGELEFGEDPRWTLAMDPCDGSNNFRRGMRDVGFAVAAFPVGAPLDPDGAAYALCGDVYSGAIYAAARGEGATLDGRPCHASGVADLYYAIMGANVGHERYQDAARGDAHDDEIGLAERLGLEQTWRLLRQAATLRRTGATVLDLCYVAQGVFDIFVDLRGQLTPENFLAPGLILREAGALLTNAEGRPIGAVEFTASYNVVAVANATLQAAALAALHSSSGG